MKLISECFVKPKHKVEAAKHRIYLSPSEILMLAINPIQKGLLFDLQQPTSSTLVNLLDKLKHSLSIALLYFYPLAGRFLTETFPNEHACTVFIDCEGGPGARLTHVAALDITISEILSSTHVPIIVRKFFDLGEEYLNYEGHTRSLLSIQVTQLGDGVFIGFSINHSVVDGTSFMHFVRMLSEILSNTGETSFKISRVPDYGHVELIKLPCLGLEEFMIMRDNEPLRDRVFNFSSKSLATIKAEANQEGRIPIVSSFQGLVSLIWRSITKARNLSSDQKTACTILINARSRVDPPLSDNYFGNHLAHIQVICKVGELLNHDDLGWAAKRFYDGIKAQDPKSISDGLRFLADGLTNTNSFSSLIQFFTRPNNVVNLVIGGSARFDMYGLDFGLGRAVAIHTGNGNKNDGKVNASQGCEGGGSVELEISLKEEHMTALEADHEFMSFVS